MKGKHGKDSKWRKLMVLSLAVMMAIVFMPAGVMADGTAAQEQGSTKATVQESNASGTASGTENQPAVKQDTSEEAASQDDNTVQSGQAQSDTAQDTVKESSDTQTNEESKADKAANQISDTDVAFVNGQGYATLQDAMKNAAAGDTITVLKDFTMTTPIVVSKAVTLDLGGHTITNAVTSTNINGRQVSNAFDVRNVTGTFTVTNGNIMGGTKTFLYANCDILLSNLIFSGSNANPIIKTFGCPKVTLDTVKFEKNTSKVLDLNVTETLSVSNCNFDSNVMNQQTVVAVQGSAVKSFNNCLFTNNQGAGILNASASISAADKTVTLKDCRIIHNTTTQSSGTLFARNSTQLRLSSTVVKNNESQSASVAAGVQSNNFSSITIEGNSAVYNNKNTAGGMNDFASNSEQLITNVVKKMKDPDSDIDFSEYTLDSKGTVKPEEGSQKPEAAIGDTTYMTLQDAITHAASGDTIKLIWTNRAGDIKDITLSGEKAIKIDKELTLDLNGHNVNFRKMGNSDTSISIARNGQLTLINNGEKTPVSIQGTLHTEDGAQALSIDEGVKVSSIKVDDSNTAVTIDGSQGDLMLEGSLIGGKDNNNPPITFGKDFQTDGTITFDLGDDITGKLNSNAESVDDIQIADGATEEIAGHVVLKGVSSPLVSVICKDGKLLVHKDKANVLYLDPVNGNDDNTGIDADHPLPTVDAAIEAIEKLPSNAKDKTLVMVMNTITVTGAEGWYAGKKNIEFWRYQDLKNGPLVSIKNGGNLKLTNITLDGNAKMQTGSSIISVESGGTLNIGEGAVLQNNRMNASNAAGGAVYVSGEKSTVNMSGGVIENNESVWGGGISAWNNAVVNMSGGIIRSNRAVSSSDTFLGKGGGVLLDNGAVMNLSGGEICSNSADEAGGGIHVGNVVVAKGNNGTTNSRLNMTCGKIEGNTAVYNGGGIYIEGGTENTYGIAEITGGEIISNSVTNKGSEDSFGGGGIYVNANPNNTEGYNQYGRLYLSNASITGNYAEDDGGGYAACPCSISKLYEGQGSAIYGNSSSSAKDIYISAKQEEGRRYHTGNPTYTIPSVMPGNVSCRWMSDNGTEVRYDYLSGTLATGQALSLHTDAAPSSSYKPAVTISGNTSGSRGGGIGSNGAVYMGSKPDSTTTVTAQKTWKGTPASGIDQIQVELYRNVKGDETHKTYIGYMNLSPDGQGNWTNKVKFENLPKQLSSDQEYEYTVGERKIPGYDATVSQDKEGIFTISNAPTPSTPVIPTDPVTKRIMVQKVWKLDDGGTRPDSVQVQLMKNGAAYGSPVTLSDANNWTATWDNLDGSSNVLWTAEEVNAPEGFTASQQTVGDKIIITNDDQKTKKNDPETPQTPDNPTTPNKPTNPKSSGGSGSGSNTPVSPSAQNTAITSTTPASSVPRTADSARLGTMLIMFGGAAAALAAVLVMKRRENK